MNVRDMKEEAQAHRHVTARVHVVVQRAGVPYEIEQEVCTDCQLVIAERPVKRTDG
jgi:hypothetical protein